jgi:hypothetical protein
MLHRLVAEKMLADEENVLQIARKNRFMLILQFAVAIKIVPFS